MHHGIASLLLSRQQAAVGCQRALLLPIHEEHSGECYAAHLDPAPCRHRPVRHRPWVGSLCPTRCPTTGTSVTPLVPLARSLGAWLALPSPSRWLHQTRLRDSVHPYNLGAQIMVFYSALHYKYNYKGVVIL